MNTATFISELLHVHDDALLADIEDIFCEIDRTVDKTAADDRVEILLLVEELVEELLAPEPRPREQLEIELELELELDEPTVRIAREEVAEVA